jgi:hypothetical protein
MRPLDKVLRNKLERTVKEARDIAEDAARAALEQLGVGEAKPYGYLSEKERELRRKLRVHGRQLGDYRNSKTEIQEIERLTEEVAYEHWHRMLFARFLAENNLLMYPDPDDPVPVSLEECEDLAKDEGAKNGWELAARFATRMLPQIFRTDSPVFQLILPPEYQQNLERLLDQLPTEVFTASDSLGWVYQFWQAKKKDEINASEVKIGARELPAVTQLFTEPYMVSFLLDNSLGAWWAARRLTKEDLKSAQSEEDLRRKASLPDLPLEYLRFVKDKEGKWTPAAGTFDGWPEKLSELKTLDPCCGSGHFLVAALLMLVPMRMELEGISARDAVDSVLRDNLNGLEIDQRCVELAAFALAITAWRYPDANGYRKLPELHLACSGLSVGVAKEEWKQLSLDKQNLRLALDWMYDEFKDAPVLGSLLNPAKNPSTKLVEWSELSQILKQALSQEQTDEEHEMGVVAHGLAKAAQMLAGKYYWIITNVPYLARGKQGETLREFCGKNYSAAKNDIATVFLDRCLEFCYESGNISAVFPQNWLFLTSYKKFREKLLKNETWHLITRLGPGAFETISGEVVKAILLNIRREQEKRDTLFARKKENPCHLISGLDVSAIQTVGEKATKILNAEIKQVEQTKQLDNPDATIIISETENLPLLSKYAGVYQGTSTGDNPHFVHYFWELPPLVSNWTFFQGPSINQDYFSGQEQRIDKNLYSGKYKVGAIRGREAWRKKGIGIARVGSLNPTIYTGEYFSNTVSIIIPADQNHLPALWAFTKSKKFSETVRKINQSLSVDNGYLSKLPCDINYWQKVAAEKYPNGLPKPYSDDPNQWIFHGHPTQSEHPLQIAVARLLGYRWPAELDKEMELSDEARTWVSKCENLLSYVDEDGIVCIPPVRGEACAGDRLLNLLATAYGNQWSISKLPELLKQADHAGKKLETWLRDKFFTQHCKLFHHRPFIWHIWDGLRDGFAALVNYHKLDRKNLKTLIYTYLGDWINRQKDDIGKGVDGAEEKLAAAENLKKSLELILKGDAPYDIFVRWKPVEKQPIGWNPDLNDGVRLNIRPFMSVQDVGKRGAGVLRDKPNIHWKKDRGKDVESAPWYHLGPEYGGRKGDRINDHHLTLAEKQFAQKEKAEGV